MKQRLFIFLLLGILILTVDIIFNDENENKITIFESEINSLIGTWVEQVGRDPTVQEVEGIIKQLIDEEILYREAVKLGLDKNDIIIKRRLAQKIGFLRQESETTLPTNTESDSNFGEPFLLGKNFSSKTISEVERSFGQSFAEDIQSVDIKSWSGPIISEYGSHLVYVNSASEAFTPELEDVKNLIINDIVLERQNNAVKEYLKELRSAYQIEILADLNEISD